MNKVRASLAGVSLFAISSLCTTANAQTFAINGATGTGSHSKFQPEKAIDGNLDFASRWAGKGSPEELRLDLGQDERVDDVRIAWGYGDTRSFTFEIAGRSGTSGSWTTIYSGTSSGTTVGFENYNVDDMDARQIRIRGFSNSANTVWTAITEVEIIGTDGPSGTTTPTGDGSIPILGATSEGAHANYPASNSVDGIPKWPNRFANSTSPADLIVTLEDVSGIEDVAVAWGVGNKRSYDFEMFSRESTAGAWTSLLARQDSNIIPRASTGDYSYDSYDVTDQDAKQILIRTYGNSDNRIWTNITDVKVFGDGSTPPTTPADEFGLDPDAEPWENFDLSHWKIDTPAGRDSASDCQAQVTQPYNFDQLPTSRSRPFFFTHSDGGMRFVSSIGGGTTGGACGSFTRSELREMIRGSNTSIDTTGKNGDYRNNWALGYQPNNHSGNSGESWGAREGKMTATLRVNEVTTTGNGLHPGRVVIGQIHADKNEPIRLYYRKLPGAARGCVYAEHETHQDASDQDISFNLIGDEKCLGDGPADGIALDELFSYEIENVGDKIFVTLRRGDFNDSVIATTTMDMSALNSGYDRADDWMYFKAGVYTQNNTGTTGSGDTVTFYRLNVTH